MKKRERENPCEICWHYHKYEEGEVCGVCGHRLKTGESFPVPARRDYPTEVLDDFLFIGTYDDASQYEMLKTLRITHILNTVPACKNLYSEMFTYHSHPRDKHKPFGFDEANQFLEKCETEGSRVLVHCMTGKNRSAAFVIAFLMKSRRWRLAQCFQWVKGHRPQVRLTQASQHELLEYQQMILGPSDQPNESANFIFGAEESVGENSTVSTNSTGNQMYSSEDVNIT